MLFSSPPSPVRRIGRAVASAPASRASHGLSLSGPASRASVFSGRGLRFALAIGGLLLSCLLPGVASAQMPFFNHMQRKLLSEGEILITPQKPTDDSGVAAIAMGVVNAPIDRVWPVVRDCQHFSKFMPRAKKSELRSQTGNKMICFIEISMPVPLSNLESEVTSIVTENADGSFKRTWTLNKGNYKRNSGSWEAYPWGDAKNQTLLIYRLDVDPDMSIPDAILRKAQTGSLPDMFNAVRARVGF